MQGVFDGFGYDLDGSHQRLAYRDMNNIFASDSEREFVGAPAYTFDQEPNPYSSSMPEEFEFEESCNVQGNPKKRRKLGLSDVSIPPLPAIPSLHPIPSFIIECNAIEEQLQFSWFIISIATITVLFVCFFFNSMSG